MITKMKNIVEQKYRNSKEKSQIIEWKKKFLEYYRDSEDPEIKDMLDYIKKQDHFDMMNCNCLYDYDTYIVNYGYDDRCNLPYVVERGNKIYFPAKYNETDVTWRFRALIKEQDAFSPHRYLDDVSLKAIQAAQNEGKRIVVIELGAMEGMFSRSLINIADELWLFECNRDWVLALKETFRTWSDKTTIVEKFVGGETIPKQRCVALNDCNIDVSENTFLIVKMDIEGSECEALNGMSRLIQESDDFLLFVCTYHRRDDEVCIRNMFKDCDIWHNKGYFCFYVANDYEEPFIRRCVLKIKKR